MPWFFATLLTLRCFAASSSTAAVVAPLTSEDTQQRKVMPTSNQPADAAERSELFSRVHDEQTQLELGGVPSAAENKSLDSRPPEPVAQLEIEDVAEAMCGSCEQLPDGAEERSPQRVNHNNAKLGFCARPTQAFTDHLPANPNADVLVRRFQMADQDDSGTISRREFEESHLGGGREGALECPHSPDVILLSPSIHISPQTRWPTLLGRN